MPSPYHLSFAKILKYVLSLALPAAFVTGQTAPVSPQNLYRVNLTSGQVLASTWSGSQLSSASEVHSARGPEWSLIGVTGNEGYASRKMVYFDASSGEVAADFYGSSAPQTVLGSSSLIKLGSGWAARAVADMDGDGGLGVFAANETSGEVVLHLFRGEQAETLVRSEAVSPLSADGWNVVGAADLNGDGYPDLILQNPTTRRIRVVYLGGVNGTTALGTQDLKGSARHGWTAAGMQDMNGDGHPDLILSNDSTGETVVNYYGGELGITYLGSHYLDRSAVTDSKIVVPSEAAANPASANAGSTNTGSGSAMVAHSNAKAKVVSTPVLIFNGTGTIANDVTAVESVVTSLGLSYNTVNSSQLDAMTVAQMEKYKLFIVPGGNSITIGDNLSANATNTVHSAVSNGVNYLGICAGGFFGGFSAYYNGLNLTNGVWFNYYAAYNQGINKEAVEISFPNSPNLDIYWQDGPELSGWGEVVGKYPNGTPAITEGYWGQGFVLLSGVHPEAPASWRYGMVFNTPVDTDLAFASSLVKAALNRAPLAHF